MFSYGMLFAGMARRHDKRFDPWYDSLKMDQLKDLCRAAKKPISGRKDQLISRLSNDSLGGLFIFEKTNHNPDGMTNSELKALCEKRGLVKSGGRFELVRRLLEHENRDKDAPGAAGKKRTPLGDATGAFAKKPRPSKDQALYNRIQRKIQSGSSWQYQSHSGAKKHSEDVYELLQSSLAKEISDKELVQKKPKKALELAKALFTSLADNFKGILMPGYDMSDNLSDSILELQTIIETALGSLTDEEKEDTLQWVQHLQATLLPYGFGEEELSDIVSLLANAKNDTFEDEPDAKPLAKVSGTKGLKKAESTDAEGVKENWLPNNSVDIHSHAFC